MKRSGIFALLMLLAFFALIAEPPAAQAQTPTVTVGTPFRATFSHGGQNAIGFRLYIDGVRVTNIPISALQAGSVTETIPAAIVTVRGQHVIGVSAYNDDAESARTELTFTARLPAPDPPTNLQITLQLALNADGSVSIVMASAAPIPAPPAQ